MGRNALVTGEEDALNETIAFADKSEGEVRKQIKEPDLHPAHFTSSHVEP